MSQSSLNAAPGGPQGPGPGYVPTEDERRVFKECNQESFWYRSLPITAIAISITHVLVTKGILTPSPRFGSLPKVAFAGLMGYIGGKVSYMKVCEEKFKKLENSPLGEALRQRHRRHVPAELNQSELRDQDPASPEQSDFQPSADFSSRSDSYTSYSSDYSSPSSSHDPAPFSSGLSEPSTYSYRENSIPQAPPYQEEETQKKRPVLYEELRSKNRENYEVTLSQKAETLRPQAEVIAPKKEVLKNKYGDAWEE